MRGLHGGSLYYHNCYEGDHSKANTTKTSHSQSVFPQCVLWLKPTEKMDGFASVLELACNKETK